MRLPGGGDAVIDARKISDYILNPFHPRGRHKARVFLSALGLGPSGSRILLTALKSAAANHDAILSSLDVHGQRYVIDFPLTHEGRSVVVRSHWIVDASNGPPRFVTAYVGT